MSVGHFRPTGDRVCVCACARVRARACARACVRACVCVCVHEGRTSVLSEEGKRVGLLSELTRRRAHAP